MRPGSGSLWFLLTCLALMVGCAPKRIPDIPPERVFYGVASWYGPGFHGRRTASGEIFNMYDYTAAHRSLPFGTRVRVTNLENGRSVVVRINDRGPFRKNRILDLSYQAAKKLDMIRTGVARVRVEILSLPATERRSGVKRERPGTADHLFSPQRGWYIVHHHPASLGGRP